MKSCNDIQSLFSEFYDDNNDEVFKHLDTCVECKNEFEKYAQLMDEVRNLPIPEPPEDFHSKLMSGVRNNNATTKNHQKRLEQERRKISFQRRFSFATTAVAACFLMAVIWFGGFFESRDGALGIHNYVTVVPTAPVTTPAPLSDDFNEDIVFNEETIAEPEFFSFRNGSDIETLRDENVDIDINEDVRARLFGEEFEVREYYAIDGAYILPVPSTVAPFAIESTGETLPVPEMPHEPQPESGFLPQPQILESHDFWGGSSVVGGGSGSGVFAPAIPAPQSDRVMNRGGDLQIYGMDFSITDEVFVFYSQSASTIWIIALIASILLFLFGVVTSIWLSIKMRNSQKSSTA